MDREEKRGPFWHAPEIAKAGYPVFPIAPEGKKPSVEGGFYAATTDLSEIAAWLENGRERHNIAVPTGVASGIVVVEADSAEAYANMERTYGGPAVKTRRGGHWYFKHPRDGRVVSHNIRGGLDRKGDGGYVLVPPSHGRTWTNGIPEKAGLVALPSELRGPKKSTERSEENRTLDKETRRRTSAVISRYVRTLAQGQRHEHLRHICGVLLTHGISATDAESILADAWEQTADEELVQRAADGEVANTIRTTRAAIEEGNATGVPSMEEITPGLHADLNRIFRWSVPASERLSKNGKKDRHHRHRRIRDSDDDDGPSLEVVRFAGRPKPPSREFIIPSVIPRYYPTLLHGWNGTAKSLISMLLALSVAGGQEEFLGLEVTVHGPVVYLDFELDADEQHRRVDQLASGLGIAVPDDLLYVPVFGVHTPDAIQFALDTCEDEGAVLAVIDSLGPAMIGDMAAAKDIIRFHNLYIAPFREVKTTPVVIDHQSRVQAGESYQQKGAFGSSYKEHLSRSVIQIERGDSEEGAINVYLRHKKSNFAALSETFAVSLKFADDSIEATATRLTAGDKARETTLNAKVRVAEALKDLGGYGYADDIAEVTGLQLGTVKNAVTALKKTEPPRVVATGTKSETGAEEVRLTDRKKPSSSSQNHKDSDDDDGSIDSEIAAFLRNPPDWLVHSLEQYVLDPERWRSSVCAQIAAELFGEVRRADEVRPVLEAYLEKEEA